MSITEARELLKTHDYFDYLNGRYVNISFENDNEIDISLYDKQNGKGTAEKALGALMLSSRANNEITQSLHREGRAAAAQEVRDELKKPRPAEGKGIVEIPGTPYKMLELSVHSKADELREAIERAEEEWILDWVFGVLPAVRSSHLDGLRITAQRHAPDAEIPLHKERAEPTPAPYHLAMQSFEFNVTHRDAETKARTGILRTAHGEVETPVFMPVGTLGTVKGLTQEALEDLGAQILLANTYHLYLRPGEQVIREMGGLHRFMSWERPILTDSGGYQVFSLAALRKVTDEGVQFRSHLDGSLHMLTPARAVEIQGSLGSDIVMPLDECTEFPTSAVTAEKAMNRTIEWAAESQRTWKALAGGNSKNQNPSHKQTAGALFGIVQGGTQPELRRECARRLVEMDFPGYAIGGLSVGEARPLTFEMVEAAEEYLPQEKPRYVMGVGLPEELPQYVALGVDMMDCVLPTRNGRNGLLFTSQGRMHIRQARYARDPRPVDESCGCPACRRYSRAYLRHLFIAGEMLGRILNSAHNVYFYLDTMRRIRQSIAAGDFYRFSAEFRARLQGEAP